MTPEGIQVARALASEPLADGDLERKVRTALEAEIKRLYEKTTTCDPMWLVSAVVRLIEEERTGLLAAVDATHDLALTRLGQTIEQRERAEKAEAELRDLRAGCYNLQDAYQIVCGKLGEAEAEASYGRAARVAGWQERALTAEAAIVEARKAALLEAADAWEQSGRTEEGRRWLVDFAREHYTPGGPSMPTLWLRARADAQGSTPPETSDG